MIFKNVDNIELLNPAFYLKKQFGEPNKPKSWDLDFHHHKFYDEKSYFAL